MLEATAGFRLGCTRDALGPRRLITSVRPLHTRDHEIHSEQFPVAGESGDDTHHRRGHRRERAFSGDRLLELAKAYPSSGTSGRTSGRRLTIITGGHWQRTLSLQPQLFLLSELQWSV
jgi:hypothetical protein